MAKFSEINDIETDQPLEELAAEYAEKYRNKHPTSETSVLYRAMVRRFGVNPSNHAIEKVRRKAKSRLAKELDYAKHLQTKGK